MATRSARRATPTLAHCASLEPNVARAAAGKTRLNAQLGC